MTKKNIYILASIMLIGLVIRLVIISLPGSELFSRWGSDDVFYYTELASNFWKTGMFTFDGIHATSGFQPLFTFLLLPFASFLDGDPISSLRIVLVIITCISLLSAYYFYQILDRISGQSLAIVGTLIFMVHPKLISICFNGTEAALSMLCVLAALYVTLINRKLWWIQGCAMALCVLCRLDLVIFVGVLSCLLVYQNYPNIKSIVKIVAVPVAVTGVWLITNYLSLGSVLPDSGSAKTLHAGVMDIDFLGMLQSALTTPFMSESKFSIISSVLNLFGAIYLARAQKVKPLQVIMVLLVSGVLIAVVDIMSMYSYREWYLIPYILGIIMLISYGVCLIKHAVFRYVILGIVVSWWVYDASQTPRIMLGNESIQFAEVIKKQVPLDEKIGSYNAGIFGSALSKSHSVINLDGVVNHSILEHLESNSLDTYLREENISYLLDYGSSIEFFGNFSRNELEFDTLLSMPTRLANNTIYLLKIRN